MFSEIKKIIKPHIYGFYRKSNSLYPEKRKKINYYAFAIPQEIQKQINMQQLFEISISGNSVIFLGTGSKI